MEIEKDETKKKLKYTKPISERLIRQNIDKWIQKCSSSTDIQQQYFKLMNIKQLQICYQLKTEKIVQEYPQTSSDLENLEISIPCYLCKQNKFYKDYEYGYIFKNIVHFIMHIFLVHFQLKIKASFRNVNFLEITIAENYSGHFEQEKEFLDIEYYIKSKDKDRLKICAEFFNKFLKKAEKSSKKDKSALKSKKQFQSDDELEEGNAKKLSKENIKKLLKGRTFYHSQNIFETISSDSLFEESEQDIDESAIRESEEKAINDFEDIDETDKEFFKLWNNFVRSNESANKKKIYLQETKGISGFQAGEPQIMCSRDYHYFVNKFSQENKNILNNTLRHNFVMHLLTLQTYGLLNSEDIFSILVQLNQQ